MILFLSLVGMGATWAATTFTKTESGNKITLTSTNLDAQESIECNVGGTKYFTATNSLGWTQQGSTNGSSANFSITAESDYVIESIAITQNSTSQASASEITSGYNLSYSNKVHTFSNTSSPASSVSFKLTSASDKNEKYSSITVVLISNSAPSTSVATPTFSPTAGSYNVAQSVTLSTTTDGAKIYYTTNGDTPTTSSTPYNGAIEVCRNLTIKAIAVKDGMTNSEVASAAYTVSGGMDVEGLSTISGYYKFTPSASLTNGTLYENNQVLGYGGNTFQSGMGVLVKNKDRYVAIKVAAKSTLKVTGYCNGSTNDRKLNLRSEAENGTLYAESEKINSGQTGTVSYYFDTESTVYITANGYDLYVKEIEVTGTDEHPLDMTSYIKGAKFEGLTVNGTNSGTYGEWTWSKNGGNGPAYPLNGDKTAAEFWNGETAANLNFSLYQTLSNLPAGTYKLSADAGNAQAVEGIGAKDGFVVLFAKPGSSAPSDYPEAFSCPTSAAVDVVDDAKENASNYEVYFTLDNPSDVTIGFKTFGTPDGRWFYCDNFTLEYYGTESAHTQSADATALKEVKEFRSGGNQATHFKVGDTEYAHNMMLTFKDGEAISWGESNFTLESSNPEIITVAWRSYLATGPSIKFNALAAGSADITVTFHADGFKSKTVIIPVTVAAPVTVRFAKDNGEGTVTGATAKGISGTTVSTGAMTSGNSIPAGTSATFTATPADWYMFDNWHDGSNFISENPYTTTVNADLNLNANFARYYKINVVANNAEYGDVALTGGNVNEAIKSGTDVTLTATPKTGYKFVKWMMGSADNSTDASISNNIQNVIWGVANDQEVITFTAVFEEESEQLKDILVAEINSGNPATSKYDVGGLIGGNTTTNGISDGGKLNGHGSYIEIRLDAGSFKAGDVISIYSDKTSIKLAKGTTSDYTLLGTASGSTQPTTFTLTEDVTSIIIPRGSSSSEWNQNPTISKIVVSRAKVADPTVATVEYETVVMQAGSGAAYTPKVTVKSNGVTLASSAYTVSYASNDEAVIPNGTALETIATAGTTHTAEITATITPTDEDAYLPTTVKFNVIVLPNETYTGATAQNTVTPTIFSGSTLYYGTTLGGNVYVKNAWQGNGGLWTKWQGTTEGSDCRIRFKVETVPMQVIVTSNTNSARYMAYGKRNADGTYSTIEHGEAGSSSFVFTIEEAGEYGIAGAKTDGDNQYVGADLYLKSIAFAPITAGTLPTPVFSVDAVTGKFTITNYLGDEYDYYYTLDGSDPSTSDTRIKLTWKTAIDKPADASYPYTYSSIKLYAEKTENGSITEASDIAEITNVIISQYERIYFQTNPKTMTVGQRDTYNGSWIRADKKDGTKGVNVGEVELDKNPVITTGNEFISINQANETRKRLVVTANKSNATDNAQAKFTVTIEGVTSEECVLNIERGKAPVHIFVDHISLNSGNKGQQTKAATDGTQAMTLNEAKLRYVIYDDSSREKVQDNSTSSSKQKYSVAVTRTSGDYTNVTYSSGKFTLNSIVNPGKEVWTATFTSKESGADEMYKPMSVDFDVISCNYAFAYNKDIPGAGGSSRDADDKDGNVALHMFAGANPAKIWQTDNTKPDYHKVFDSPWRKTDDDATRVGQEKTLTASTSASGNNYGDMHGWEQYTMSTPNMTMNSMTEKHGPGADCELGFKYESYKYDGTRDEFAVPVMGTFYRFTPLYDGYMAVYMLANGNNDDGNLKNDAKFNSFADRRIFFVDNKGVVTNVTNAVMQDRATLNPGVFKILPENITKDSEKASFRYCIGKLLENWEEWGNPTSIKPMQNGKSASTSFDDIDWTKWANLFNDKEGIHFKPIKNDDGSFSFIYKAYVRFVLPVEANKVVYVSPTGTKTSLAAVEFFKTQSVEQTPVDVDFYNGTGATSDSTPYTYNPTNGASVASTGFDASVAMLDGGHYNVTLKDRSFKAGQWYSFCMPFDIPETQIHEIFGEDAQTLHFHSVTRGTASEGGLEISVNFIQHFYDQTIAGHPIFIRTGIPAGKEKGEVCWPAGTVKFTNLIYQPNAVLLETQNSGYTFKGCYTPTTMAANTYFLNGSALYHVAGTKTTAGNRAWIEGPASEGGAKATMMSFGLTDDMESAGGTTGIEVIEDGMQPSINIIKFSDAIYTVNGQMVGHGGDLNSLPSGVYVINGKKIVK